MKMLRSVVLFTSVCNLHAYSNFGVSDLPELDCSEVLWSGIFNVGL